MRKDPADNVLRRSPKPYRLVLDLPSPFYGKLAWYRECWVWLGGANGVGYGLVHFRGAHIGVHKAMYLHRFGPLPAERPFVLHSCDVRICARPEHLFAGSALENTLDAVTKGRTYSQKRLMRLSDVLKQLATQLEG